ncbi:Hypothetical predicted protein [Pelobates cultripes]|uniref:Uncharacterized protein n=1 Tax=Pelobates cultripes TaxID=61616 RepID=A0AAD1W745_PELCU|nr:Hypothetical predicted protein [Pelobates cultripes]
MFLISPSLLPQVTNATIGSITWSEHADISLTITITHTTRSWSWRLNPTHLHNTTIRENIRKDITEYFDINKDSVSSASTLWAAHKSVIWGKLIAAATAHKKQQLTLLESHLTALRAIKRKHKTNPDPALTAQLHKHRQEIQKFMVQDSKKALQWARQMFYEKSNKADTLLDQILCQRQRAKHITKIRAPDGQLHNILSQIANTFQENYSSLYDHNPDSRHNPSLHRQKSRTS